MLKKENNFLKNETTIITGATKNPLKKPRIILSIVQLPKLFHASITKSINFMLKANRKINPK